MLTDVEAPPPSDVIRKGASQQGTGHAGDPPHAPDEAKRQRPLPQGQRVRQDDDGPGEEPGGAHAGDGAAHDEGRRGRRGGADQAPDLEDEDGEQVDGLDGEAVVQLAVQRLQRRGREQVGAAVPADVPDGRELLRDGAQGRRYDGLVQGDEEDGQAEGEDDEEPGQALGIDDAVASSQVCGDLALRACLRLGPALSRMGRVLVCSLLPITKTCSRHIRHWLWSLLSFRVRL